MTNQRHSANKHTRRPTLSATLTAAIAVLITLLTACSASNPTPQPVSTIASSPQNPTPPAATTSHTSKPATPSQPLSTEIPQTTSKPGPTANPQPTTTATNPFQTTPAPPEPPATEEPTTPSTTAQPIETGQIAPLKLDTPQAIESQLSTEEFDCLSEIAEPDRLHQVLSNIDLQKPEEMERIITCLHDETLLRLTVTGITADSGPFSIETSQCLRSRFIEADLRSILMNGLDGNAESAMAAGLAALTTIINCLNDQEWETIAPTLDMNPGDRKILMCIANELGGPQEMAKAITDHQGEGFTNFQKASEQCGPKTVPENIQNN